MPIDEFIITVFCWVEKEFGDVTDGVKLRARGFAPHLSGGEVITMEIVGESDAIRSASPFVKLRCARRPHRREDSARRVRPRSTSTPPESSLEQSAGKATVPPPDGRDGRFPSADRAAPV
jgi:hypothetical protein